MDLSKRLQVLFDFVVVVAGYAAASYRTFSPLAL
jgi:hypothetical protein